MYSGTTFSRNNFRIGDFSVTNPIQNDPSLTEWIQRNKIEAFRRAVLLAVLCGVVLYAVGEISSIDWAIQTGIWLLLAGLAAAVVFKFVSYIIAVRDIVD